MPRGGRGCNLRKEERLQASQIFRYPMRLKLHCTPPRVDSVLVCVRLVRFSHQGYLEFIFGAGVFCGRLMLEGDGLYIPMGCTLAQLIFSI